MVEPRVVPWLWRDVWRWPLRRQRWVWVVPPLLYAVTKREQIHVRTGVAGLVGIALVILVARRPYKALNVLVVILPFSTFILSTLLRFHVPGAVVRAMGFWKEGILAGLAVAAISRLVKVRPTFDWADKLAFGYVVLGSAYLVLPRLFVGTAIGGSFSLYARELGWRGDVLYVGVFLICRHLGLQSSQVWAIFRRFLGVAFAVAAIGVYEFIRPWSFNHFMVATIRVPAYQAQVLHSPVPNPNIIVTFANGSSLVRVGSVLINNLPVGFYFILGLGVALEMISRGKAPPWVVASLPVLGAALLFTQSRAAIGGGAVTTILGLRAQLGRSIVHRVRLSAMVAVVAVAAIPILIFAGLGHRFSGSGASNQAHTSGIRQGISVMAQYPMGRGLATGAGGGQTAVGKGLTGQYSVFIPEDQWLQIGTQLGILGLLVYVSAIVLMLRRLRPRSDLPGPDPSNVSAAGARIALIGILAGGLFLQPFTEPVVSWTVFALCGLAAGVIDRAAREVRMSPDVLAASPPAAIWKTSV